MGLAGSSAGKESNCNAEDPGLIPVLCTGASQGVLVLKDLPANAGDIGDAGSIPRSGNPLEKGKATHSSTLAWRIPWTIQSMGSQRVGHD